MNSGGVPDQESGSVVGTVVALHRSAGHTFSKPTVDEIELVAGLGVRGDAHQGARVQHRSRVAADPDQPNLRQVHLMHRELFDRVAELGFTVGPGDLGENVTTEGIDLLGLPVGASLAIGPDAIITLTGLRNPCRQINQLEDGLLDVMIDRTEGDGPRPLAGVMGVVVRGGLARGGQSIAVSLPPLPHHRLERI